MLAGTPGGSWGPRHKSLHNSHKLFSHSRMVLLDSGWCFLFSSRFSEMFAYVRFSYHLVAVRIITLGYAYQRLD